MQQAVGISGLRFERVAERVAEVEQSPSAARLALVLFDDARLSRDGGGDRLRARGGIAGEHLRAIVLEPGEQLGVFDQRIFDDLGIAGADLPRIERVEQRRIDQHERRLVERADQILARRDIDRRLAADRAVDLREKARRHLHKAAAAIDDRRGETGEVADDAATEGNDVVAPLDALREQRVDDGLEPGPALARLACAGRGSGSPRSHPKTARRRPPTAAHTVSSLTTSSRPSRASGARYSAGAVEQTVLDQDVVTALPKSDVDRLHRVSRTAPGEAASGRQARAPSSLRRSAPRECRRTDRAAPW